LRNIKKLTQIKKIDAVNAASIISLSGGDRTPTYNYPPVEAEILSQDPRFKRRKRYVAVCQKG